MKNKIIVIFLLIAITLPIFNFANAKTFLKTRLNLDKKGAELEISDIDISTLSDCPYRVYIKEVYDNDIYFRLYAFNKIPSHNIVTGTEVAGLDYGSNYGFYSLEENSDLYVRYLLVDTSSTWEFYDILGRDYDSSTFGGISFNSSTLIYNNFDLIRNGEVLFPSCEQDEAIGDSSSDLVLTYEYNEDNTECHIDATLKNGAFTDKIYYSNLAPSISGQGLLTKKAFPSERFNRYRKSKFIFSS